jgi:hypothetical protein
VSGRRAAALLRSLSGNLRTEDVAGLLAELRANPIFGATLVEDCQLDGTNYIHSFRHGLGRRFVRATVLSQSSGLVTLRTLEPDDCWDARIAFDVLPGIASSETFTALVM